ncbi:electron transfer flavoprotein subunit alpha/FixB family protein [Paenibacillus mesophilus]|uniref:electron transfer flavoprotein subunit alpha/FixB family protein n=1 Tax=Paenibacillus mesophilus TaxID=2582849 RepID=UPI00110F5578|nr:electron transfer flavoprotein subunit alpha/FixB family protein [Paenibacillus mesophilus]TMV50233.1 electron transfer flavoprotein subunit alpha/FixB family protein [Paenibacillus mesophilus]
MNRYILVITEQRDGMLRQVSLEAIAAARLLAGDAGTVAAFLSGTDNEQHAARLLASGADRILSAESEQAIRTDSETVFQTVSAVIAREQPAAVVLGHTAFGKDIAPRLAVKMDTGQISDVIAIEPYGDSFAFTRPIYAGKAFEKRLFRRETWVITIRPNNFQPFAGDAAAIRTLDSSVMQSIPHEQPDLRSIVKDVVKRAAGKTDLSEAKIIVSGGRGVRSADGFKPLAELAEALGGAVGASRGACDAGYCDYSMQIGQTGKVVTPELYIACGISGAIQHLAGMSGSRVIVAINKDPEAPIFKIADYGLVGDLFEIVPLLTEEIKRLPPVQ